MKTPARFAFKASSKSQSSARRTEMGTHSPDIVKVDKKLKH